MVNQYAAVEDKLKELGYNVQSKVFDDSVQPDVALAEGSIDCNWYQHEPYLKSYNEKNGTNLGYGRAKDILSIIRNVF